MTWAWVPVLLIACAAAVAAAVAGGMALARLVLACCPWNRHAAQLTAGEEVTRHE